MTQWYTQSLAQQQRQEDGVRGSAGAGADAAGAADAGSSGGRHGGGGNTQHVGFAGSHVTIDPRGLNGDGALVGTPSCQNWLKP